MEEAVRPKQHATPLFGGGGVAGGNFFLLFGGGQLFVPLFGGGLRLAINSGSALSSHSSSFATGHNYL